VARRGSASGGEPSIATTYDPIITQTFADWLHQQAKQIAYVYASAALSLVPLRGVAV
jgi:hypothetical protein